jgi:hypothetical protein
MKRCASDPCVFVKHDNDGEIVLLMSTHIDDALYSRTASEIDSLKAQIRKHVNITNIGAVKLYLGVGYKVKEDEDRMYIKCEMQDYIGDIIKDYKTYANKSAGDHETPGKPQYVIPKNEGEPIDESDYGRIIGKALFAIGKVCPDSANVIRERTSHLSNPGVAQWKAGERLVGYLKHHYQPSNSRRVESCGFL